MSKCFFFFFLIDQRTSRSLIGEKVKLVADLHRIDMTMPSGRQWEDVYRGRRDCLENSMITKRSTGRSTFVRINRFAWPEYACRSQLDHCRSHRREFVICKRVEMLPSDLFAQRSNVVAAARKPVIYFNSRGLIGIPAFSFFTSKIAWRVTHIQLGCEVISAGLRLSGETCGSTRIRRNRRGMAIEIQRKLHRARQKRDVAIYSSA